MKEFVDAVRAEKRQVSRVWHPDIAEGLLDISHGVMAYSLVGNPAYQLSSGDIVAL